MKVVYTYIVGDILHFGHLLYLANAKALGDKLIVGVLTDKAVKEKKSAPVVPFVERVELVRSLVFVDAVVTQDAYSPLENVKVIRPDILVESTSHEEMYANEFMKEIGGRVVTLPYFVNESSSGIKKKIEKEV